MDLFYYVFYIEFCVLVIVIVGYSMIVIKNEVIV